MEREHLTPEKVKQIEKLSHHIGVLTEDIQKQSAPATLTMGGSARILVPIERIIDRHDIEDLLETYRLLLLARLQKRRDELQAELLEVVNAK